MLVDVALHWALELVGGAGLACGMRLCDHPECGGRVRALRAMPRPRPARAAAYGIFTLATSILTVLLLG